MFKDLVIIIDFREYWLYGAWIGIYISLYFRVWNEFFVSYV
jgi:hypothetical protein